jgi:lipopolysaccharide/colanic/teichoic acid biosynthesis glycosyltransferase
MEPALLLKQSAKRAFDVMVAFLGIIIFAPTFLLVSIATKLESGGQIFCSQSRFCYKYGMVRVLTFRSIVRDKSGSHVTIMGALLRRTGIGDLPQLINVLRGEMSIVGLCLSESQVTAGDTQSDSSSSPYNCKPGIISWAQVNGFCREVDTTEERQGRLLSDLYYVENWSLLLDMKIILMRLFSKSAYGVESNSEM